MAIVMERWWEINVHIVFLNGGADDGGGDYDDNDGWWW